MSLTPTYPGVYIEEIPSGQHTVTPVATNIAAFVGRAPVGPIDDVLTCLSFGDYQRFYGGLAADYPMSYAVRDFFANGGAQAEVCRLFEADPAQGSGVAQLPFPVSPPMIPEGWMLAAPANVGATSLTVSAPTGGSEGDPDLGMVLNLNSATGQQYTVTKFTPADAGKKTPASISIMPALSSPVNLPYPMCTPLIFQQGPTPSGWTVLSTGQGMTVRGGSGIPDLGDVFTVGSDPTPYAITQVPVVTVIAGAVQLQFSFAPKPTNTLAFGAQLSISPPQPSPMALNWQIAAAPVAGGAGKPSTMPLVNGTGAPLVGDQFVVGDNPTLYVVTGFTAATAKAQAQVSFIVYGGGSMPTDPHAFCFCCPLEFTRPAPQNWAIAKAPKIGDTSFTVGTNSGAASGVIDIGCTFIVQGDESIYTVVLYDQPSGTVSFLPEAETGFLGQITFSPPLQLVAASPGAWGNGLQAKVDTNGITDQTAKQFLQYDLETTDLFNLTLQWNDLRGRQVATERYLNVSVKKTSTASANFPNRLDHVLATQSSLARVGVMPLAPPASGSAVTGSGGNDGAYLSTPTYLGDENQKTGLYLLDSTPVFNLLCVPPDRRLFDDVPQAEQDLDPNVRQAAATYCTNRRAIFIADPPAAWEGMVASGNISSIDADQLGITGMNPQGIEVKRNAAVYFPRIVAQDILLKNRPCLYPACGMIAGIIAATDVSRGVWKAPAGLDAGLAGVSQLASNLSDSQNGILNPLGINCLRSFPIVGPVVWGARTLMGADQLEDDYKYLPVRRLTLFIESSLYQATQWAVFEPNDEALWSSLRLSVGSFLADLARQGAFYNYAVTCDATTTTPTDIANGRVNILVQIAPVEPAEFVVITIQQAAISATS